MTSQQILVYGGEYLGLLRERQIPVPEATTGLLHGLIDYLVNQAALEEDCLGVHEAAELREAGEDLRTMELVNQYSEYGN